MLQRFAELRFQFIRIADTHADVAIGLRHAHKVRQRFHIRLGVTTGIDHVLPLLHHAQVAVIQIQDQHREIVLQGGRKLLNVHLDTAITGHAHDDLIRERQFDA
ncbi:hypothetical protein D3C72_1307400 [compost metagenome]